MVGNTLKQVAAYKLERGVNLRFLEQITRSLSVGSMISTQILPFVLLISWPSSFFLSGIFLLSRVSRVFKSSWLALKLLSCIIRCFQFYVPFFSYGEEKYIYLSTSKYILTRTNGVHYIQSQLAIKHLCLYISTCFKRQRVLSYSYAFMLTFLLGIQTIHKIYIFL